MESEGAPVELSLAWCRCCTAPLCDILLWQESMPLCSAACLTRWQTKTSEGLERNVRGMVGAEISSLNWQHGRGEPQHVGVWMPVSLV